MAVTYSVKANGAWTDFSAAAGKAINPSSTVDVGHRGILVLTSTVDGGVNPGASGWGAIVSISDPQGNTWNRDNFGGPVDGSNMFTTVEVWSAYIGTQLPTNWTPTITPDSRGLSAYWAFYDVAGLLEDGGSTSPLDKVNRSNDNFTSSWTTGASGVLSQADEWCLAVFGNGSNAPSNPWLTDTAGFTSDSQQSGSGPGSTRALAALSKTVSSTSSVTGTGTTTGSNTGAACISTYKILVQADISVTGVRGSVTVNGRQGTPTVSNPPASGAAAKLIINQAANRW